MTETSRPTAPSGLGKAGRKLWRSVLNEYEIEPHAAVLLGEAARTADLLDSLQARLDAAGDEWRTVRPLAVELRQQRLTLTKLLSALHLPAEDDSAAEATARAAAKVGRRMRAVQ